MLLFKRVVDLQAHLQTLRQSNKTIGFVPTMGALHDGHLQLIRQSQEAGNDITVCSIFVNPRQFDDKKDLELYPRPIEQDIEKLTSIHCDILFLPSVDEIYPNEWQTPDFDFGELDKTMEGAQRPGHFKGMAQVVHRLLWIVQPNRLYMGQKDFQQVAIVKNMLQQLDWSHIELVRAPIVREADGLAMSSRNVRLSPAGRAKAKYISQTLREAAERVASLSPAQLKAWATAYLHDHQLENIDYFEIINSDTLQTIETWDAAPSVAACTVVRVDGVRLLDNIILK